VRVYLIPVSFGWGPAALATAVARQLRVQCPQSLPIGVADGIALDFLSASGLFDRALEHAAPGRLPESVRDDRGAVAVFFADFDRLVEARIHGCLRTVMVDPLYWMWDRDPIEPSDADSYFALAFPGVSERIAQRGEAARSVRLIPQIVDLDLPLPAVQRSGTVLNLGGAVAPSGDSTRYLRTLIRIVAGIVEDNHGLLVTCSATAAARIGSDLPTDVMVAALPFNQMMRELGTRARLLTLPGQSIMWEALRMRIPTIVLPGANYSQHRQMPAYQRYFSGAEFITWDDFTGYATLPAGLAEDQGVARAAQLGDRLTEDDEARVRLAKRLAEILSTGPVAPPALRDGHPWSSFDGAVEVAREIMHLAETAAESWPATDHRRLHG
jgi:hypothetical protein